MVAGIKISGSEKAGFTLAEVLITLTIIGVIAALTIPSLIVSFQKYEYATKLESFFSTTNAGFKKIMADKGCSDIPCTGILDANSTVTMTNIQNTGVFNIVKKCDRGGGTGCHDAQVYYLNNVSAWIPNTNYALFVTSDGMVWGFSGISPDCSYNIGSGGLSHACNQQAIVDINGPKSPNIMGRDIFRFYLLNDGRVVPSGMDNDSLYGVWWSSSTYGYCSTNKTGEGCAARIAQEGWQMNY